MAERETCSLHASQQLVTAYSASGTEFEIHVYCKSITDPAAAKLPFPVSLPFFDDIQTLVLDTQGLLGHG